MDEIGILVFNDVEELDFVGPLEVFGTAARLGAKCQVTITSEERQARASPQWPEHYSGLFFRRPTEPVDSRCARWLGRTYPRACKPANLAACPKPVGTGRVGLYWCSDPCRGGCLG